MFVLCVLEHFLFFKSKSGCLNSSISACEVFSIISFIFSYIYTALQDNALF